MDWYCEKLHCLMLRSACQKRRQLANDKKLRTSGNQYKNAGCGTCTQTEANMEYLFEDITKVCKICNETKRTSEFGRSHRSHDGLEHKCIDCRKKPCREDRPVALVVDGNTMVSKPQEVDRPVALVVDENTMVSKPQDDDPPVALVVEDRIAISVDFTDYPELHSVLMLHAYSEMRTPEMQAAYMLRELLIDIKPVIEKKWGEWA